MLSQFFTKYTDTHTVVDRNSLFNIPHSTFIHSLSINKGKQNRTEKKQKQKHLSLFNVCLYHLMMIIMVVVAAKIEKKTTGIIIIIIIVDWMNEMNELFIFMDEFISFVYSCCWLLKKKNVWIFFQQTTTTRTKCVLQVASYIKK